MAIINNTKLSAYDTSGAQVGISTSEIATVLGEPMITDSVTGVTGDALGYLCSSAKINPMSKCKPLRHPKLGKLDSEDRKGSPSDVNQGIFYGLKVASNKSTLDKLHEADWSYIGKPTGDINSAPYRKLDFDGYDHNAKATLSGTGVMTEVNYNASIPFTVLLEWNITGNTTGVDVGECLMDISGTGVLNYADIYLYALIGDYMTGLINNDVSLSLDTNNYEPVYYNGVYCKRFSCPKLPSALQSSGTRKVTIVAGSYNSAMMGTWVNVYGTAALADTYITIPNMAGIDVYFSESGGGLGDESGRFTGAIISIGLRGNSVMVSWTMAQAPAVATTYRVNMVFGGRTGTAKTFTLLANAPFGVPILEWTSSELGLVPTSGEVYTVDVSLYALDKNGTASLKATASGLVEWGGSGGTN